MADVPEVGTNDNSGMQPIVATNWWKTFWILTYVAALILICFISYRLLNPEGLPPGTKPDLGGVIAKIVALTVILLGSLVFVQIYTRPIADRDDAAGPPRSWFVFAYAFMVTALVLAIVPFTAKLAGRDLSVRPISVLLGCVKDPGKLLPTELRCGSLTPGSKSASTAEHELWILNVGGSISSQDSCGYGCNVIRGGLAVPLYVVILALAGGAISLTRRVPEYQKQAAPHYTQTVANKPKLDLPDVREYLVFQIVQYLSAPLIAVTAYYAIRPSDTPSTVALAFVSGFASEPILLMIRGIVDKITPASTKVTARGSVSVRVERGDEPVTDATVRIVGQQTLKAKLDNEKRYVFETVPVGEHAIEVKSNSDKRTEIVMVSEGQVATCEVKL